MKTFKRDKRMCIGDIVECISIEGTSGIELGKLYRVTDIDDQGDPAVSPNLFSKKSNKRNNFYLKRRFVHAEINVISCEMLSEIKK